MTYLKLRHRFKTFRSTTRFKRCNIGRSKAVRKLYIKRLRRTNSIVLSYLTVFWVKFFVRARQLYRFLQAYGYAPVICYSSDLVVLRKKLPTVLTEGAISSFACAKKVLKVGLLSTQLVINYHLVSPLGDTPNAALMFSSDTNFDLPSFLGPSIRVYDDLTYPFDEVDPTVSIKALVQTLHEVVFRDALLFTLTLYQFTIYLVLNIIFSTKTLNLFYDYTSRSSRLYI